MADVLAASFPQQDSGRQRAGEQQHCHQRPGLPQTQPSATQAEPQLWSV